MSSGGDIVLAVDALVVEVGELVKTDTLQAIVDIARELGAGPQVSAAVDTLVGALHEVSELLAGIREPLAQLSALSGLLGLTSSLVTGLRRLVDASAEELAPLGGVDAVTGPLAAPLGLAGQVLGTGAAVLGGAPGPDDVDRVRASIDGLAEQLLRLKEDVG